MDRLNRGAFDQDGHESLEAILAERFTVIKLRFVYFLVFVPGTLMRLLVLQFLSVFLDFQGKIQVHSSKVYVS